MELSNYICDFIEKYKSLEEELLNYFDTVDDQNILFQKLQKLFSEHKIGENKHELKTLLHLISKIIDNHHRSQHLYGKFKEIINYFQKNIKNFFTNYEIFNIFKSNKLALLILFDEKLLIPDKCIASIISQDKYTNRDYKKYFYNEFKDFIDKRFEINNSEHDQKRKIGECTDDILQLVRDDSIDEFKEKYDVDQQERKYSSYFETNLFLIKNQPTLIEYAAFFGSYRIFQFLLENWNKELNSSLWLFVIHGANIELIKTLENSEKMPEANYEDCIKEAIKCHNFDLFNYFSKKVCIKNEDKEKHLFNIFTQNLHFYNFINLSDQIKSNIVLYDYFNTNSSNNENQKNIFKIFCKFDYFLIVNFLMKNQNLNLKSENIFN